MVHSVSGWTRGVQVKLWDPLSTRAIPERLRGVFTTRRYTNPRLPLPKRGICYRNVCLSVRPSVTLVSHAQTVQNIEILFTPYDRAMFPLCEAKFHNPEFRSLPRTSALNGLPRRHTLNMISNPRCIGNGAWRRWRVKRGRERKGEREQGNGMEGSTWIFVHGPRVPRYATGFSWLLLPFKWTLNPCSFLSCSFLVYIDFGLGVMWHTGQWRGGQRVAVDLLRHSGDPRFVLRAQPCTRRPQRVRTLFLMYS